MDVSVSETMDQKTYLRKFEGGLQPLSPPGSAYGLNHLAPALLVPPTLKKVPPPMIVRQDSMCCSSQIHGNCLSLQVCDI